MQSNDTKGIVDGSVTIYDPRSAKAVEPCLGLHGNFEKRYAKNFYHNLNCFLEAKKEHDVTGKNTSWISIFYQLKEYHNNSTRNINAFSVGIRGFDMCFQIYILDFHHKVGFLNKASACNGFLCLYLDDKGVQILPQYNTYEPQIITYNMLGSELDRHSIHTIFT